MEHNEKELHAHCKHTKQSNEDAMVVLFFKTRHDIIAVFGTWKVLVQFSFLFYFWLKQEWNLINQNKCIDLHIWLASSFNRNCIGRTFNVSEFALSLIEKKIKWRPNVSNKVELHQKKPEASLPHHHSICCIKANKSYDRGPFKAKLLDQAFKKRKWMHLTPCWKHPEPFQRIAPEP